MIFRTLTFFFGGPLRRFTLLLPPVLGKASAISSDKLEDFFFCWIHLRYSLIKFKSSATASACWQMFGVLRYTGQSHLTSVPTLRTSHETKWGGEFAMCFLCWRDLPPVDTFWYCQLQEQQILVYSIVLPLSATCSEVFLYEHDVL